MLRTVPLAALLSCFFSLIAVGAQTADREGARTESWQASGRKGALITGSREAADAGLAMLQAGGNAVDAAVATMLVQSVVEANLFCFGSEVPILVFDAKRGVVEVIAGLGAAPQLATTEWFRENRAGLIQGRGDIANCVVPGFLDACLTALDRYGTRTLTECAAPMLEVLRGRAAATPEQARSMMGGRSSIPEPDRWIAHHQNFLRLIGRLTEAEAGSGGDRRRGLRLVADYFYRGPVARELDAWSREAGGLLRFHDMAQHHTPVEEPLTMTFRGHTVCKAGVWTQGPYLLQTLGLLEPLELEKKEARSTDYIHTVVEAMKLCLADRDTWFADPHFSEVPIAVLLSEPYLALRRTLLDPAHAATVQQPGDPLGLKALLGMAPQDHQVTSGFSNDTSSCLVADEWGNVVAATPSGWGGVVAGDTGIEMGSRLIGLTCWERHPSQLQPGKRPRITLTPTLILREGCPVACISVAGGDQQDQASLQVLLNRIVFELDPAKAVRSSRFGTDHHINWFGHLPVKPASLTLPRDFGETVQEELSSKGHVVATGRPAATAVLLTIDPASGEKTAAGENGRHARSQQ